MLTFSQVARDSLNSDWLTIAVNKARTDFEANTASWFRHDVKFVNSGNLFVCLAGNHLARQVQILRRNYIGDVHRRYFFTRVAGYAFAASIKRSEVALKIVGVDDVVGILEEFAIALFAFSNRSFCSSVFS